MSPFLWLPLLLGAAAVFLLLPRPRPFPSFVGALAGLVALGLGCWFFFAGIGVTPESILFVVFSVVAIVAGGLLVTHHNPARAALSFALVVLSTCGLFMLLAAPFLMAATIVIYAGAIVVTFLFVLMLAQQAGPSDADARSRDPGWVAATGCVLLGALLYVLHVTYTGGGSIGLIDELLGEVRQGQAQLAAGQAVGVDQVADQMLKRLYRATEEEEKDALGLSAPRRRGDFAREVRRRIESALVELLHEPGADAAAARADSQHDLNKLATMLTRLRDDQGVLRPASAAALSPLSGPPANTPSDEIRVDRAGRPQLPAENTLYLGRALFTDFLLPVELGGTLLLVATIGAIAIAQRRVAQEKPL